MLAEDELLDVKDVATRLRVNPRTVLRMAERGDLPAIKVASRWRFRRSALDEYLQEQPQTLSSQHPTSSDWRTSEQGMGTQSIPATVEGAQELRNLKAESRKQATQLDVVQQQFDLVQKQLTLVDNALETADKLVTKLHPRIDEEGRAKLLQKLLPSLLEPGNGKSLELVLSAPAHED